MESTLGKVAVRTWAKAKRRRGMKIARKGRTSTKGIYAHLKQI